MALFLMILRKMVKNRWLELSLLIGLIISVALASSMPIYTHAILQRMLIKDLEVLQADTQQYPGQIYTYAYLGSSSGSGRTADEMAKQVAETDVYLEQQSRSIGLPVVESTIVRSTNSFDLKPTDPTKVNPGVTRSADITAMKNLEQHIRLIDGKMPAPEPVDGVYEALIFPEVMTNLKLVLGNEFTIVHARGKNEGGEPIRIKPVGVIDRKSYDDLYWSSELNNFRSRFLIPFELFEKDFTAGQKIWVDYSYWFTSLEYHALKLEGLQSYTDAYSRIDQHFSSHYDTYTLKNSGISTFQAYYEKENKLRLMLWSLNVPVIMLLAFYLFMVANLITERQKTEIAVLRSRGASRWQILLGYTVEGCILGAIALGVGPYLGLELTGVLGASNGFLEFVQRSAMEVKLNEEAYRYALVAVVCSVIMTLIPVVLATRVSIVGHKQTMARQHQLSFAHKIFIDVILMGVSIYLLISFHRRMSDLAALGLDSMDMKVDPLLFLVPALFVLAMGLLLLRLYPWLVRLVYWLGRKWWPPYLYSTLLQVGRSATQYQFIMLFLILTIATGLFSASAARTMNSNIEDKIRYKNGADIVLRTQWENDAPPPQSGPPDGESKKQPVFKKRVQYTEPPFLPFGQLPGVEAAARVFDNKEAFLSMGKDSKQVELMGIDTDDFGRTAWMRDNLLDHHIYEYLNLMADNSRAVLISRSVAEEMGVNVGDVVRVGWNGLEGASCIVYGIIDYWPSWNPNPVLDPKLAGGAAGDSAKKSKVNTPMLVVGHLSFIQNSMAVEPYDVWLKLKPNATSQALYDALEEKRINLTHLSDTRQLLIRSKNDPFQLAINGVMTLGFLIAAGISFIGFLLYWVLSLSGRILQFGVLRAMGVSFMQIIGMLAAEQVLTSGAAVLIGVGTGNTVSKLFVPLFQLSFDPTSQVPPFQVHFDPRDQLHLYIIVAIMISIGLFTLGTMLSRIKIHQAVKLGED